MRNCTVGSFDLYWIAVDKSCQGQGLGRSLLLHAEEQMRAAGARRLYIDTSGRADYLPTRAFYEKCGYTIDVIQKDFYDVGDDRVIFVKVVGNAEPGTTMNAECGMRNKTRLSVHSALSIFQCSFFIQSLPTSPCPNRTRLAPYKPSHPFLPTFWAIPTAATRRLVDGSP